MNFVQQTNCAASLYSCFVFAPDIYPQFQLGASCARMLYGGHLLYSNLAHYSDRFKLFENHHLAFHLGDHYGWWGREFDDYKDHNLKEYEKFNPISN